MVEYRPVPAEHDEAFHRLTQYAFEPTTGPYDPTDTVDEHRERLHSFGDRRGVFEDSELRVGCKHIEFTVRVRETWLPMAGLAAVASDPATRRQGLVGELLAESLAEYRDRGWPIAALWPFDEAFYAQYGWATASRHHAATVEPAALSVTTDAATGSYRRVTPEEYDTLEPVFQEWLDSVTLATRRSADWWRDRILLSNDGELFCYAWCRDDEPRGYVVYDVDDGEDGRRLRAHEFAYVDHEAYLNLLHFCFNHDSQVSEIELVGPGHDRLIDVVMDRDALELTTAADKMLRIVDVPAALERLSYPDVDGFEFTLSVADEQADWNDDTFRVTVQEGEATVTDTDASPDASVDVGTLSQLFVGYLSVDQARERGELAVHSTAAADALATLFPEQQVYLPESF